MEMGEKIKYHRERLGMTLEELGDKVGVGKSTVRKWENGIIANMRRDKIDKIAKALNVSPGYLMGWDENDPTPEYYQQEETAALAQKLFEDKNLRILFDAAKDSKPEDLQMAADLLARLKQTNPDG